MSQTYKTDLLLRSSYFDADTGIPLIRIRDISREQTEHRYWGEFDDQYLVTMAIFLSGWTEILSLPNGLVRKRF